MKRSIFLLLMVSIIACLLAGCGETKGDLSKFNGIPFGAPQKEVMPQIEAMLKKQSYEGEVKESNNYNTTTKRSEIIDTFDGVKLDDNIVKFTLTFLYSDGTIKSESPFYEARYEFPYAPFYKIEELANYYKNKFIKIYGEPSNEIIDGEQIQIRWSNEEGTCLIYNHSTTDSDGNYDLLIRFNSPAIAKEYDEKVGN